MNKNFVWRKKWEIKYPLQRLFIFFARLMILFRHKWIFKIETFDKN